MIGRILLDNDTWLITAGLLGGIKVRMKTRNIFLRASRGERTHLLDTLEALQKRGVSIKPGNPKLEEVFEMFAEAVFGRGDARWQAYFMYTPESIADSILEEEKANTKN